MVCFFLVSICFFCLRSLRFVILRIELCHCSMLFIQNFIMLYDSVRTFVLLREFFEMHSNCVCLVNLCANCNSSCCLRIIWGPTVEGQEYANWIQQTSQARFGFFFTHTRTRLFLHQHSSTVQNTNGMSCGTLCFNFPSVNIILMAIWTCFTQIVRSYFHSFLILWI